MQINIPRASKRLLEPHQQQHGPLQYEPLGVLGLREPVEQTLDCIVRQDQIEIQAPLLAYRKEPGPNRGPDVLDPLSHLR